MFSFCRVCRVVWEDVIIFARLLCGSIFSIRFIWALISKSAIDAIGVFSSVRHLIM